MRKSTTFNLLICLLLVLMVPNRQATAQMAGTTTVGIVGRHAVAPGQRLILPVEVIGAQDLYAVDLALQYDPMLLRIIDADLKTAGTQVALGTFLDPGLLLSNEVNETTGTLRFVMSQANPSEAKSGDGVLLVVSFEGLKEGVSDLKISRLEMSTREGLAIAGLATDSQLTVKVGAPVQPDPGIPTQPSGALVFVPPSLPTAMPTAIPQPTTILQPTKAPEAQPTAVTQVVEKPAQACDTPTNEPVLQVQPVENGRGETALVVFGAIGVLLVGAAVLLLLRKPKLEQTGETGKK